MLSTLMAFFALLFGGSTPGTLPTNDPQVMGATPVKPPPPPPPPTCRCQDIPFKSW